MRLAEEQIIAALQPGLFGGSCIDRAIAALRQFEPPEGYFLAFSGGKDSICIKQLAIEAGVKYQAHYHMTTVDPPEVVQFIRKHHPDVVMGRPPMTMRELIAKEGLPSRQRRFCCRVLKEGNGRGQFVIDGVRATESVRRKERAGRIGGYVEVCYKDTTQRFIHPIIDWTDDQVWAFIHQRQLPYPSLYDEGFTRIGCVICPMSRKVEESMARWPKLWKAAERAAARYYASHTGAQKRWPSAASFFSWWCDRDASLGGDDEECIGLFSAGMEAS